MVSPSEVDFALLLEKLATGKYPHVGCFSRLLTLFYMRMNPQEASVQG